MMCLELNDAELSDYCPLVQNGGKGRPSQESKMGARLFVEMFSFSSCFITVNTFCENAALATPKI